MFSFLVQKIMWPGVWGADIPHYERVKPKQNN